MKRSHFMLAVVMTSMALVAGCSRTAHTPPPVANLDVGPPTQQDEDAIRDQMIPCWNFPAGVAHPENYRVAVKIEVSPDGKVTKWTVDGDSSRLSDPTYMVVLQQAVNAVNNPSCQPLRFPPGKYWPSITIDFDPKK